MLDKESLHKRVQEMIACQTSTDPLKGMSELGREADLEEAAVKWLALAILHGVNQGAEKIGLEIEEGGEVEVSAKYRKGSLPNPGPELAAKIMETMRGITHQEAGKYKGPLAVGIGNDNLELFIKFKDEEGEKKLSIKFPE